MGRKVLREGRFKLFEETVTPVGLSWESVRREPRVTEGSDCGGSTQRPSDCRELGNAATGEGHSGRKGSAPGTTRTQTLLFAHHQI